MSPLLAGPFQGAWDASVPYVAGNVVLDRGGTWRCVSGNTNSQPISGNTNWTLVGGTPYVEVTLSPVALTSSPFFDSGPSGSGVELVPGTPGKLVLIDNIAVIVSPGLGWPASIGTNADLWFSYGAGIDWRSSICIPDNAIGLPLNADTTFPLTAFIFPSDWGVGPSSETAVGLGVSVITNKDITNGGNNIGTHSLTFRSYYSIVDPTPSPFEYYLITALAQGPKTFTVSDAGAALNGATGTFAVVGSTGNNGTYTIVSAVSDGTYSGAITGVNQGTKTYTVAGDHTANILPGDKVTVASSTGNNGLYTVVTATLNGGNTDIVVVEVIPNPTVDGTLSDTIHTVLTVVEAIPSATADGWVKR